ncbi:MAG: DUF5666 domain-containing protein, partial [Acidobacteria bacterium]|nr:DUF5666 domain-containing protein [Acidobacteriota bacterium]
MRTKVRKTPRILLGIGLIGAILAIAAIQAVGMQSQDSITDGKKAKVETTDGKKAKSEDSITDGKKAKVEGAIIARDGDTLTVRDKGNADTSVIVNESTEIALASGPWGIKHRKQPATELLTGLWIEAHGAGNTKGQLVASKIVFDTDAMETAKALSGLTEQFS